MCDRITHRPPRDDQSKPRLTLIPTANPLSEIVPDTFSGCTTGSVPLLQAHAG